MFYRKPLHVAYASPRGERSRLVPESVGRSSGGPLSLGSTDRMRLLEGHINTPLDRSRVDGSPRQGVIAASDQPVLDLIRSITKGFSGNSYTSALSGFWVR